MRNDLLESVGETQFRMGRTCKRGHNSKRYASGGECIACRVEHRATPEYKKATAEYEKKRRARPGGKAREAEIKRKMYYGIMPTEYNFTLAGQQYRCAICTTGSPGGSGGWHVDHCHATDKVRGILCHHCNTGIGKLGDNAAGVRRALEYLERFECKTNPQTSSPTPTDVTGGQSHRWPNTAQAATLYIPLSAGT